MTSLMSELRRRSVFRVAASYVVVSWIIIQVVSAISMPLALPAWFETVVIVLLGIGFPLALIFAWAFDLTPDGIKRTEYADRSGSAQSTSKLDYALIVGLLVVAAATFMTKEPATTGSGTGSAYVANGEQSIAVLPFVDMSPEGDQEYFGDGIAEELLNELTRLDGLRVAGRTSSFAYKNSDADLKTIGEELNTKTILEGSIRKDGDRVRITAQLINVADGYHIWSETYDREFADIFAIQEDIASAVAGTMGVTLGVGGVNAFRGAGTRSIEAYELFLRGEFERATQVDPNYAAAWAGYAVVVGSQMWINPPEEAQTILLSAHALALKATELDSESAQGYTYLATILYPMWDWTGAEVAYRKAQTLLKDRWTLEGHANMLMRTGRTTRAIEIYDAARAVEPLGGLRSHLSAYSVIAQQGFEEATEILKWADESWQRTFQLDIGLNKRDESLIKAALRDLISQPNTAGDFYANVLREFDSPTKTLAYLQETFANQEIQWPSKYHDISLFAAYFGNPEFALRAKAEEARYTPVRLGVLWYPMMSEMRQLPAFKELVTEINLVEYWRAYGWADACRPLGDNDFECR